MLGQRVVLGDLVVVVEDKARRVVLGAVDDAGLQCAEHLIVPEILVFSRTTWDGLSKDDQALIKKVAREAQLDERQLWKKVEAEAIAKMKASGIEIDTVGDKTPFQTAVKPVWDKYGARYADLIKRIQAVN